MRKLEKRLVVEGREVRFTNFIDAESFAFEQTAQDILGDAATEQTLAYAKISGREHYVMQTRAANGVPALQAIVYLGRPKLLRSFAMASVPNFYRARNPCEEEFGLRMLRKCCAEIPHAMTLRIQPQRFDNQELVGFELRSENSGYKSVAPLGVTHTLMLGLEKSAESLAAKMPQKTRSKFRHATRAKIELRTLSDASFKSACREATNDSRKRSGSTETPYDFNAAFAMAKAYPDRAQIIGLFLKQRPDQLLAYVIGYRNGTRAEYASAGSFSDPELRSMPFNYFLFWELANWARAHGAEELDMGGVTPGDANDPLQGVSRFKRSIATTELEVGREVMSTLKPVRYAVYQALKEAKNWLRAEPNQMGLLPVYD